MDIQEMIDRRIAELESEPTVARVRPDAAGQAAGHSPGAARELKEFGRMMDAALAQVAAGVLEISERITGDYSRMERNILRSRLEALETIESVLDVTLRLRSETMRRLGAVSSRLEDISTGPDPSVTEAPAGGNHISALQGGMAALFKKTI